jgi:hypothetical protein
MTEDIPRLFADLTGKLEDMHSIAIEGRRTDNALDMQRVLASQLRMSFIELDTTLGQIKRTLGDGYE